MTSLIIGALFPSTTTMGETPDDRALVGWASQIGALPDHLLPAIHDRIVLALSNQRIESYHREALILAVTGMLRRAATVVGDENNSFVTQDRLATSIGSRRQMINAMASASGFSADVAGATLLLIEARIDTALEGAGAFDLTGIGKFSRMATTDDYLSESPSKWCQLAFNRAYDCFGPVNFWTSLFRATRTVRFRQLVTFLEMAEALRPPLPYQVTLSSSINSEPSQIRLLGIDPEPSSEVIDS